MAMPSMSTASSYGSGRADDAAPEQFPAGLRVLVVDDDVTCLRILEHMLQRCRYRVTTCCQATIALSLLRERKGDYDVVISDVHMPDMDGFKLLELVGLEMDLPVIMMSADGRTSAVMRGIEHGACDYLIKPVRIEELKNIWQHVLRKKWNGNKELDHSGSMEDRRLVDDADYASSVNDGVDDTCKSQKKKRDVKDDDDGELDNEDPSASKKPRVVWSVELHQQFVSAVNHLGIEKAVPKRILESMNVPGLTRENVASHLQKFRLYLKRLSGVAQHQSGLPNSFCGPVDGNGEMSSFGRLDFQALAASGQIPPQTLAALHAELFGQPSSGLVLPAINQPFPIEASVRGSKSLPIEQGLSFGQPVLNFQSKQLPHSKIADEDSSSGFSISSSDHLGTTGSSRILGGFNNTQSGKIMMQMLQQRQPCPVLAESNHAIYMQPSCVVVPSESSNRFQSESPVSSNWSSVNYSSKGLHVGIAPAFVNKTSKYNTSSTAVDCIPLSSQSTDVTLAARDASDGRLKNVPIPVLNGGLMPQSCPSIISPCSARIDNSNGWQVKNSTLNQTSLLPDLYVLGSKPDKTAFQNHGCGKNLGFVGKGTCISSRFGVDDIESPINDLSHRKVYIDDDGDCVKQELHLDFVHDSTTGNTLLPHFS